MHKANLHSPANAVPRSLSMMRWKSRQSNHPLLLIFLNFESKPHLNQSNLKGMELFLPDLLLCAKH
jgi:hypothetical protein